MEESVTLADFLEYYKKSMDLEPVDVRTYSPLVLAYIGDAVYELMIRSKVINKGSMQVNKMHKHSAEMVKASAQASLVKALQEELTAEELAAYKRGRNAKSVTMAKHATMIDYRMATGLEALVGWLFLNGQYDRLVELVSLGLKKAGFIEPPDDKGETQE
ncbi:MAG: ribonuclease III [Clostridium sp.]|nr:ribonuclease III [Clostridium sp.]